MTEIAVIYGPGDLAVVTGAAELAVDDSLHGHIIGAHTHFETQFVMTDPALKADAMEPVRINDRPDPFLLRVSVKHDIRIFRFDLLIKDQQ